MRRSEDTRGSKFWKVGREIHGKLSGEWRGFTLTCTIGVIFLCLLQVLQPYYFTHDDNATQNLPMRVHNLRSLLDFGELAWMNFHQYLGHAHFLSGQSGVFYLPAYVATALSYCFLGHGLASVEIDVSLHFLTGIMAMYLYLRVVGVSRLLSGQAALLYITTPFIVIVAKSWVILAYCTAYVPILLFCWEAWFRWRNWHWLVIASALKIGFFFQGNVQFVFMFMFAEVLYAGVRLSSLDIREGSRLGISWILSNVLACVGALPLIWPMAYATQSSASRAGALNLESSIANAIQPWTWLKAQFFIFKPGGTFTSSSALLHLGAIILIFVFVLAHFWKMRGKDNQAWALLTLFIAAFVLSTKANVVLHILPPFDRFRWPFKWYFLFPFASYALAAWSLRGLILTKWMKGAWSFFFVALALSAHVVIILSSTSFSGFGPFRLSAEVLQRNKMSKLKQGRVVPYGISSLETPEAVVEARTFNFATLLDEAAFHGYDPLIAQSVDEEILHLNHSATLEAPLTPRVLERLSSWSVRYLVTQEETHAQYPLNSFPELEFIGMTPSRLMIWENHKARPWAWLVETSEVDLPVTFKANSCVIQMGSSHGHMVVSLFHLDGWRAFLDGNETALLPNSDHERHIRLEVPAGVKEVTLRYFPPFLKRSLCCAILAICLLLSFWWKWERSWSKRLWLHSHESN